MSENEITDRFCFSGNLQPEILIQQFVDEIAPEAWDEMAWLPGSELDGNLIVRAFFNFHEIMSTKLVG